MKNVVIKLSLKPK